jgi:predicted nucleic acid-binding protein
MKVVIDSSIFVSFLDPKDIFHNECYPVLEKLLKFEIEALCPSFVLVEVTCVIRRRTNSESLAVSTYKNLVKIPAINWLDFNLEVAQRACMLGAKTGLKAGDVVILHVSEQYGIPLLTKDKEIKQKAPKNILVLEHSEILP